MYPQLGEKVGAEQHVEIRRGARQRAPERGAPAEPAAGDTIADRGAEQCLTERIHGVTTTLRS